jgi:hypothetical protein
MFDEVSIFAILLISLVNVKVTLYFCIRYVKWDVGMWTGLS